MFAPTISSGLKLALAATAIILGWLFAVIVPTGTAVQSAGGVVGTLTADSSEDKTQQVCLDGDGLFGYLPPSAYETDSFRARLFSILTGRGIHPRTGVDPSDTTIRTVRTKAVIPKDLLAEEESASLYRKFWDGKIQHDWHKSQPEEDFNERMNALETASSTPSVPEDPVLISDDSTVVVQTPAPSPDEILDGLDEEHWDEHAAIPTIDSNESPEWKETAQTDTDLTSEEGKDQADAESTLTLTQPPNSSDDPLKYVAEEARKGSLLADRSSVSRSIDFIPAPQPVYQAPEEGNAVVSSSQSESAASPTSYAFPPKASVQENGVRSADLVASESYLKENHVIPVKDLTSEGNSSVSSATSASVANLPPAPLGTSKTPATEDEEKSVVAVQARPLPNGDTLMDEPQSGHLLRPVLTQGVVNLTPDSALAPQPAVTSYTAQSGETLESIADRFQLRDGTRDTFFIVNGSKVSSGGILAAGTKLFIPASNPVR